jgi:hypothetical protein
VISLDLARRLQAAGAVWTPSTGDRFVVLDRDLDDQVFLVSDMVVEVRDVPMGRLLCFNGTTEWALDSILQREVVWLPREDQLRALLGNAFVSLSSTSEGFEVVVRVDSHEERHIDADPENGYARALLSVLRT